MARIQRITEEGRKRIRQEIINELHKFADVDDDDDDDAPIPHVSNDKNCHGGTGDTTSSAL